MKRKANVRLTLNRETLRHLSDTETNAAQGGAVIGLVTQSCFQTYCICVTQQTCPSECGQWYCYGV